MKNKIGIIINKFLKHFGFKLGRMNNFVDGPVIIDLRHDSNEISPLQALQFQSNHPCYYLFSFSPSKFCVPPFFKAWVEVLQQYNMEDKSIPVILRPSFLLLKDFYEKH